MLHKLQFRYNQSQLEELDDEILDDDVGVLCQRITDPSLFYMLIMCIIIVVTCFIYLKYHSCHSKTVQCVLFRLP